MLYHCTPPCQAFFDDETKLRRHRKLAVACRDRWTKQLQMQLEDARVALEQALVEDPEAVASELVEDVGNNFMDIDPTHHDEGWTDPPSQQELPNQPAEDPDDDTDSVPGSQGEVEEQSEDNGTIEEDENGYDPNAHLDYRVSPSSTSHGELTEELYEGGALVGDVQVDPYYMSLKHQQTIDGGDNIYYPFTSENEWRLAKWMNTEGLSQSAIDRYCKEKLSGDHDMSFGSGSTLNKLIAQLPALRTSWKATTFTPRSGSLPRPRNSRDTTAGTQITFFHRDPLDAIQSLLDRPSLKPHMEFVPRRVWGVNEQGERERVYTEIFTRDWAWEMQETLPIGGTLIPVILGSDKTHLTVLAGDKHAWPVYLSIGNIKSSVRNKPTNHAWVLIAYIPVVKYKTVGLKATLQGRLFHECMRITLESIQKAGFEGVPLVDSTGAQRQCFPIVAAYLADNPEQTLINTTPANVSPTTIADTTQLGSRNRHPSQTKEWILSRIRNLCRSVDPQNVKQYHARALKENLGGIDQPFWEGLRGYKPELCLSPDILHGLHRFWRDHILPWIIWLVGANELDRRLNVLQAVTGIRHFGGGIKNLSQWSGREDRELQRVLLAVIAGCPEIDSTSMRCLRAMHDFLYLAQYKSHSATTLGYLKDSLTVFHDLKGVFIANGAQRGEHGVIPHFNIPKLSALHGYLYHIPLMGTSPQFSNDVTEQCHQTMAKQAYRCTNKKDYEIQMCQYLDHRDQVRQMDEFLQWIGTEHVREAREVGMGPQSLLYRRFADNYEAELAAGLELQAAARIGKRGHIWTTLKPTKAKLNLQTVAKVYRLKDLKLQIQKCIQSMPNAPRSSYLDRHVDVWYRCRIRLPTIQDEEEQAEARVIDAHPPSKALPFGHCGCVLLPEDEEAESIGMEGHRVAQVRLIFRLWFQNSSHPLHAVPLAYVQWFTRPRPQAEPDINMYRIKRAIDDCGHPKGSVVELSSIQRWIQLIPYFHATMNLALTQTNSMDICTTYHVNSFTDKEIYQAVW